VIVVVACAACECAAFSADIRLVNLM
jgi:hypothetical protein